MKAVTYFSGLTERMAYPVEAPKSNGVGPKIQQFIDKNADIVFGNKHVLFSGSQHSLTHPRHEQHHKFDRMA